MITGSPRGTSDIFGQDMKYRNFVISTAAELFKIFNYMEIITPAFEHTEIFDKSIGDSTDIVRKEMYTFLDKKGRSLTLRPEGTAPVVRAVIEHKMYAENLPLKLYYIENMFRYERPQKGRMREFWQLGVEAIGSPEPFIDAEVIWLLNTLFEKLGFKNLKLLINSMGCIKCRNKYKEVLTDYLFPKKENLCPDCQYRLEKNPLRIFDCKVEQCGQVIKDSPKIYSYICADCRQHFDQVIDFLKTLNINFIIKEDLVRGFDYYTRTIFEIISEDLKSVQNALGGGGRYDKLIEQLGGPDISSIGFAVGLERTYILMKQLNLNLTAPDNRKTALVILMDRSYQKYALSLIKSIRDNGYTCDLNYGIKSIGSQIKSAEKNAYDFVIIIGEDEVKTDSITIKDIRKFTQYKLNWKNEKAKIFEIFDR
ncbi:MAG: histidine--tRNA ligase [Actinobacteria bacterium]|nr:histidine--tRNA ligase [Actinomycetota bacterium]MCL5072073.1 histidine--tRNA ligase [Actinomycetota bacterium]